MSISEVVATAARAIESRASTDVRAMLAVVAQMPAYVSRKRLDLWEEAVAAALPPDDRFDDDEVGRLALELFELAQHNMYGAIEVNTTARLYSELVAHAAKLGVDLLTDVDLREW